MKVSSDATRDKTSPACVRQSGESSKEEEGAIVDFPFLSLHSLAEHACLRCIPYRKTANKHRESTVRLHEQSLALQSRPDLLFFPSEDNYLSCHVSVNCFSKKLLPGLRHILELLSLCSYITSIFSSMLNVENGTVGLY